MVNAFHLLFVIAVGFLSLPLYEVYKRHSARNAKPDAKNRDTLTVVIFSVTVGTFLLFTSIPGAFLDQPHWFTNNLYWVVEKVFDVFT